MATSHTCSDCEQTYDSDMYGTGDKCPYCLTKANIDDEVFDSVYN